jgi:hypothetical protein
MDDPACGSGNPKRFEFCAECASPTGATAGNRTEGVRALSRREAASDARLA